MTTTVYFLRRPSDGYIKIGRTLDLKRRPVAIGRARGETLALLATADGPPQLESYLHRQFHEHRADGEWFKPCATLLRLIEDCNAGKPPTLPRGALSLAQLATDPAPVSRADIDDLARNLAEQLVDAEPSGSRMVAYDKVAARIGVSASWLRHLIGRRDDLVVEAHSFANILIAYREIGKDVEHVDAILEGCFGIAAADLSDRSLPNGECDHE